MLYGHMLVVCRRYARNEDDAFEILNTGFLKMFRNLKKYQSMGKGSFEGWVKRIMINSALDHLRSLKSYLERMNFDYEAETGQETNMGLYNLEVEELYRMLEDITPMSRTVFNLYALDGYSHKEIAEKLGISVGTSKWHLYIGRQQLQEQLRQKVAYRAVANA